MLKIVIPENYSTSVPCELMRMRNMNESLGIIRESQLWSSSESLEQENTWTNYAKQLFMKCTRFKLLLNLKCLKKSIVRFERRNSYKYFRVLDSFPCCWTYFRRKVGNCNDILMKVSRLLPTCQTWNFCTKMVTDTFRIGQRMNFNLLLVSTTVKKGDGRTSFRSFSVITWTLFWH